MPRLYNYETKSYEEIPDELVRQKVLSREYGFNVEDKVPVIAPDGSRYMLPGEKAYWAFQQGGNYGSSEDWQRIGRKEEHGEGWDNYLGAGAAGGLRGATLGLSDPILRTILGKERMQTWREELPGISIGTEIGGAILPAVFSGGGTTAASGAMLTAKGASMAKKAFTLGDVLIPSKGVFKAGRMLEESLKGTTALARGADKGLALKILSTSIPKAAAGALEGATFGAGTTLTESMLGDPKDVTELLLSNVGYSALFGGLANAGLNAAIIGGTAGTKGLGEGFASIHQKVSDSAFSAAAERKLAQGASDLFGNSSAETLMNQFGWTTKARKARQKLHEMRGTFEAQSNEISGGVNSLIDDVNAVTHATRRAGKAEAVREKVYGTTKLFDGPRSQIAPGESLTAVRDTLLKWADDIDGFYTGSGLDSFEWLGRRTGKAVKGYDFSGGLESVLGSRVGKEGRKKAINDWFNFAARLAPENEIAFRELGKDAFLMLDDFKKFTGNYASFGAKAVADPALAGRVKLMNEGLAELLERESFWGKAANLQAKINPLHSSLLIAQNRLANAGLGGKINPRKIAAFLENASGNKEMTTAFNEYLTAAKTFSKSVEDTYNFSRWGDVASKEVSEAFEKAAGAVKRMPTYGSSTFGKASKLAEEVRAHKALFGITGLDAFSSRAADDVAQKLVGNIAKRVISRKLVGGAGGYLLGGPLAAAGGVIVGGLMDGASTARQLAHFEHAARTAKKHLNKSLDSVVTKMTKGGPGGSIPSRPNRTKLFLAPLAAQFGEEETKKKTTKQEDYKKAKERALNLQDPQGLSSSLNNITADFEHYAPNLAEAMKDRLALLTSVVLDGFNKDSRTMNDRLMGVPERQPTDREMAQQDIRFAVVEDPVNEFCGALESGTCTKTHSETMQRAYPNLFLAIKAGIWERIADRAAKEDPIPYQWKLGFGIAFGEAFDVSQKPENITTLQASYGEKSEEGTKIKSTPLLKTMGAFGPSEVEQIAMG